MSEVTITIINVTDYRTESVVDVIWRIHSGQQQTTRFEGAHYTEAQGEAFSDIKLVELLNRSPGE